MAKALKWALGQSEMSVIGPMSTSTQARRLIARTNPRLALVDVNLEGEMACDLINELHAIYFAASYAWPTLLSSRPKPRMPSGAKVSTSTWDRTPKTQRGALDVSGSVAIVGRKA